MNTTGIINGFLFLDFCYNCLFCFICIPKAPLGLELYNFD